ncbi:glucose-1-phosphate thymidylyltransferase [Streptomyces triticirhizae]|uniref:Glucose-1-phosphate thymidylyltransferase n=1 Tax=Streptomyces triticirhizae TaxID=2483353 RepID=A0A3M2LFX0_9ACTN|nr:glucose-1-phosphate thymidylyltransferase [Streptomyces triticirhizae]RMI36409.1 glucose-1-phosphate thymidylyltransferase [Streptomyces triticirhizae]
MKALVLAGGSGTRLRPITHTMAKQLVPVAGEPVLFHGLRALADAGVNEVGMVVGGTRAQIREAVGDGSRFGLRVTYLWQEEPLGLAHAVSIAGDFLGDDEFLMYLGDNLVLGGLRGMVDGYRAERPAARLLLAPVADPRRFGVAEVGDDGRVVGLQEKPAVPRSDLAVVGVYLFGPDIHKAIAEIEPSARGELEITDAIQWLIDRDLRVSADVLTGYWKDTGTVADVLEVNRHLLRSLVGSTEGATHDSEISGPVVIGPGADVTGSTVIGPSVIGPGAVVTGSRIGPFASIGEGCRISGSAIRDSIVMPRSSIAGVRGLESSLIGQDVEISRPTPDTGGHQLVLGDGSRVGLVS